MKSVILLLCLIIFAPLAASAQWYRHKSEAKLTAMTPDESVSEWIREHEHHKYDMSDERDMLIRNYILIDGLKGLPRVVEIIDKYAPTKNRKGGNDARFEGAYFLLNDFDNNVARLRASEEGRRAINAFERAIERMRAAGYSFNKDGHDWNHGLLEIYEGDLKNAKGINNSDRDIQNTFWFVYKIKVLNDELLEFSNYLTEHHQEYPSWSERTSVENREESPVGFSVKYISFILKNPEPYREAYSEFKKTK